MGGKKVRDRIRLKKYIVLALSGKENQLQHEPTNDYIKGWVDALKWVLNKE